MRTSSAMPADGTMMRARHTASNPQRNSRRQMHPMYRRATFTAVVLACLTLGFSGEAAAERRGRSTASSPSSSAAAATVGTSSGGPKKISSFFVDELSADLPLETVSEDDSSFDRLPEASYGPVVAPRFSSKTRRSGGGRPPRFLWDIQPQLFSGFRPRGAVGGPGSRLRYQRRGDDQSSSTSKRKKLMKSDMFYAVRGRRRYDGINEDGSSSDSDDDFEGPPGASTFRDRWRLEPETLGGNSMTAGYFPAGRRKTSPERPLAAASRRQVQKLAAERALKILNEEDEREREVERGTEDGTLFKDKREPPTGFHAIRGKRQVIQDPAK